MSEAKTLFKMVIVLGMFFLFVGVLPGQSTPAAWVDFENQLSGQGFPEYENPWSAPVSFGISRPTFPGTLGAVMVLEGCDDTPEDIPNCVNTRDGESSYIVVAGSQQGFEFNWTNPSLVGVAGSTVRNIVVTVNCRSASQIAADFTIFPADVGSPIQTCPVGPEFRDVYFELNTPGGYEEEFPFNDIPQAYFQGFSLDEDGESDETRFMYVSYIEMEVLILAGVAPCTAPDGAWIPALDILGCQITQFFTNILKFIQAVVNGIVYVGAVIYFGLLAMFNMILGFFQMISYLYAIPDTPDWAQIVVSVFVTGALVYIVFIVVSMIRGSDP